MLAEGKNSQRSVTKMQHFLMPSRRYVNRCGTGTRDASLLFL